MWSKPTTKQLSKIPKLYSTENVMIPDKKIWMHFFMGGSDWFIAEFDGLDTMFGYCIMNNDELMAEWGYVSYQELLCLRWGALEVDRDRHWKVRKFSEI